MAILWYDGFDHYGSTSPTEGIYAEWMNMQTSTAQSRTTSPTTPGKSALMTGFFSYFRRSLLGDFFVVGIGAGFWVPAIPALPYTAHVLYSWRDVNDQQLFSIDIGTTGRIRAWLGAGKNNLIGSSSLEIEPGVWNHIEAKLHAHATAGSIEVRVNGKVFLKLEGICTVPAGNATTGMISQVYHGQPLDAGNNLAYSYTYLDDICVWNDQGSSNNDFLGMLGVYTLRPDADVNVAWAMSSGSSAYPLVSEINPDDDASYISSVTTGQIAAFGVERLPDGIDHVAAVMPVFRAKKGGNGACTITPGVVSGGTTAEGDAEPLTTVYGYYRSVFDLDPHSGLSWDPHNMPNIQLKKSL